MKFKQINKSGAIVGSLGVVLLSLPLLFQNCSEAKFSTAPQNRVVNSVTAPPVVTTPTVNTCSFNGATYNIGDEIRTYPRQIVPFDQECVLQAHKCLSTGLFEGEDQGQLGFLTCAKAPPPPPEPTGRFSCRTRESAPSRIRGIVKDLFEEMTDGTFKLAKVCSDYHSTRVNRPYNCGKIANGNYHTGWTAVARQPDCCPDDLVGVNGMCMPIALEGQACFGPKNCKDGLFCNYDMKSADGNFGTCRTHQYGIR